MGKFSKYLGNPEPIEIDGEEYLIKPLTVDYLPQFFKAMKAFSGASSSEDASTEDMLKNIDDEGLESLKDLIIVTLQKSYPEEWEEHPDALKTFAMKNMAILMNHIFEINSADLTEDAAMERAKQVKDLKKKSKR